MGIMDAVEYQLLSRVAARDRSGVRPLEDGRVGESGYTVGRLLQLRARGLISFADQDLWDYHPVAACRLTRLGERVLQHHHVLFLSLRLLRFTHRLKRCILEL